MMYGLKGLATTKARMVAVGLTLFVMAVTPTLSSAIPTDGTYTFNTGEALQGSFTVTAQTLSDWSIIDTFGRSWTDEAGGVLTNSALTFWQRLPNSADPSSNDFLQLRWNQFIEDDAAFRNTVGDTKTGHVRFHATQAVPEPSSLALMGLGFGLLVLLDYVRRQRRQAELQIG